MGEAAEIHAVLVDGEGDVVTRFHYQLGPYEAKGSGLSASVNSLEGLVVIRGLDPAMTYRLEVQLVDGRNGEALIDPNLGRKILLKLPPPGQKELRLQYLPK